MIIPVFIAVLFIFPVSAEVQILYKGMHFGKAWIQIDGKQIKLKTGQTTDSGVKLLSVNKSEIVVSVNGQKFRYAKGSKQGFSLEQEVSLRRDAASGGYWAKGYINNQAVLFILDTGASYVTLNKKMARKMKINTGNNKIKVYTASKKETAYLITLASVQVGDIKLENVPAIITRHDHPIVPLLGMSFLSKVEISQKEDQMTLKYASE